MCCLHRFLNYHTEGLFPSWNVKYLFIGTFNPSWNKPGNNADYFYGRSAYFWLLLPRFVFEESLNESSIEHKVTFCKRHLIGFTDLIRGVNNVDFWNEEDRRRILTYRDNDLLEFGDNLDFNTPQIIEYIENNPNIERIYFTLLAQNAGAITLAIQEIEEHCAHMNPVIPTCRLHTHTGQGLRTGIPRANVLTHRWFDGGMNFINEQFNPEDFPFE